jgi:CRP/FNR family transcriptional regulator, cyclic AMP receptor protein
MANPEGRLPRSANRPFDLEEFLESGGVSARIVRHRAGHVIYAQGDSCESVLYLKEGKVKLAVLSPSGKEAIVGIFEPGDFFGEGALSGQPLRLASATTMSASTLLVVEKQRMIQLLHAQHALSDRFLAHLLSRNARIEADLLDQLFNSSEKRLARTLLLLARYGRHESPHRVLPRISQEALAEMVGTTRSRVNFFMNKFRKLGYIEYNGGLKINDSLMTVVLHD